MINAANRALINAGLEFRNDFTDQQIERLTEENEADSQANR